MNLNFEPKFKAIAGDWFNSPLAIYPPYLDYMIERINGVKYQENGGLEAGGENILSHVANANLAAQQPEGFVQTGTAAIIPVHGPISYRRPNEFFRWLFGGTSYAEILSAFRAAQVSDKIDQIIFNFDSPGGTVVGFEDAVNEIFKGRSSKKITSYINPYSASAAYGLASAAHEIHVLSSSGYGSIGTVMMHLDQSKFDEKLGAKWTPIFAGARKVDGNSHFPLSDRAKKRFQEIVDTFYKRFVSLVARNRGISESDVRKTEAELYYGDEGKEIGLIDLVINGFNVPGQSSSSFLSIKSESHIQSNYIGQTTTEAVMTLEELKAKYPELFKQIQQESAAPFESKISFLEKENTDLKNKIEELKSQNKTLSEENTTLGERVQSLEEKDIIRTESEMKARADAIWVTALVSSDVPSHLHGDIRQFVSHSRFIANGRFDEIAFTDAVKAKIKDWEDKGVRSSVILGSGVPVNGKSEQKVREEKADNEAVDELVTLAQS